jgi:exopolyphosphatase/guanosine-5'-triphosphate,3'-diphosphate pyrophosphatase
VRSARLGAIRLADRFHAKGTVTKAQLEAMREYAREVFSGPLKGLSGMREGLGSSGTIQAVVAFASEGKAVATTEQLSEAVTSLTALGIRGRRRLFEPQRADIIVAGAVVLEALAAQLKLERVHAVDRGLRDGVLLDLSRRAPPVAQGLRDAALELVQRLGANVGHATRVERHALALHDGLRSVLRPQAGRQRELLSAAALLHDVGEAISPFRHHKHSQYVLRNAELPGLLEEERELTALLARFHRRNRPELDHPALARLAPQTARWVQRLAVILRMANALDWSQAGAVQRLVVEVGAREVRLRLKLAGPADVELQQLALELDLFRRAFHRRLTVGVVGASGPRSRDL